jgi:hypothetical protein
MTAVNGLYLNKLIKLSLSGDNMLRSFNHEALHAMKDLGFFSAADWNLLEQKARSEWMAKYDIAKSYGDETTEIQLEEAIAHAFADVQTQAPAVKSIMSRVVNFLKRIGNWLKGNGYRTAEDVFQKAAAGKLKGKATIIGKARAENLAKWFGDSKVVNADGSPKVVYHGTDKPDFSIFDPASWFSENPLESSAYTNVDVIKIREKSLKLLKSASDSRTA